MVTSMNLQRLSTPQRVSAIAMLVVIVGAFLPWVSILGISALGVEGDGVFTALAALAGLIVLLLSARVVGEEAPGSPTDPSETPLVRESGKVSPIVRLVLAVLVTLVGFIDMNGAAAIGLYLTLFGGIAWVVGGAWELSQARSPSASEASPATD